MGDSLETLDFPAPCRRQLNTDHGAATWVPIMVATWSGLGRLAVPHRARLGKVVEDAFGPIVQLVLDGQKVLGCVGAKVDAPGEVVAQQAVHVLVRAALPGPVGVAEVDRHAQCPGDREVAGHRGALVPGDRPKQRQG